MAKGELNDVLNEQGGVIGTKTRVQAEADNDITGNVLVFLFDKHGRVWIQLRPETKKHYPGLWDISVCEGIWSGETPEQTAVRGIREEAGIEDVEIHHVESFLNIFPDEVGQDRKRYSHLYIGITDQIPNHDGDEIDEFRTFDPEDLRQAVTANPELYIPSFQIELEKAMVGYQNLK